MPIIWKGSKCQKTSHIKGFWTSPKAVNMILWLGFTIEINGIVNSEFFRSNANFYRKLLQFQMNRCTIQSVSLRRKLLFHHFPIKTKAGLLFSTLMKGGTCSTAMEQKFSNCYTPENGTSIRTPIDRTFPPLGGGKPFPWNGWQSLFFSGWALHPAPIPWAKDR